MTHDTRTPPPWYRQFWPWFLILLPASAVAAGIATLIIAMDTTDGLVADDYYKQGLAINERIARDQAAAELGLSALTRYDAGSGRLWVQLAGGGPAAGGGVLRAALIHPTRAHLDRELTLRRTGEGVFEGDLAAVPPGRWHVRLEPADSVWRLSGRMPLPESSQTRLVPATGTR